MLAKNAITDLTLGKGYIFTTGAISGVMTVVLSLCLTRYRRQLKGVVIQDVSTDLPTPVDVGALSGPSPG